LVKRDVAMELDQVLDRQFGRAPSHLVLEWAAPDPSEAVLTGFLLVKPSESLHQKQWILLGFETPDGQQLDLLRPRPIWRTAHDVPAPHDRFAHRQEPWAFAPVALGELGSLNSHRQASCKEPIDAVEEPDDRDRGHALPTPNASAVQIDAVLSDAEHDALPANERETDEQHGERMRTKGPDDIDTGEAAPEPDRSSAQTDENFLDLTQTRIVGKSDELDALRKHVFGYVASGDGPAEDDEGVESVSDFGDEKQKRAVGRDSVRFVRMGELIHGVDVDAQPAIQLPFARV
jgi:hypothetical protein